MKEGKVALGSRELLIALFTLLLLDAVSLAYHIQRRMLNESFYLGLVTLLIILIGIVLILRMEVSSLPRKASGENNVARI